MTSLKQTSLFTKEALTSLAEGSPVNHTVLQDYEKERPMKDTSFLKCLEQSKRLNQDGLLAKMFVDLLVGMGEWYSTRCAMTWKGKAMKSNRFLFQLQVSAHRTKDKGYGLWLSTPRANEGPRSENFVKGRTPSPSEYAQLMSNKMLLTPTTKEDPVNLEKFKKRMEKYPNGTTMPNLATQVMGMLPTPKALEAPSASWENRKKDSKFKPGVTLTDLMIWKMLPTPRTSDQNMHWKTENWKGDDLGSHINEILGTRSHLSPLFVEEMMGFPENWTLLPFLNGEMSQ